MLADEQRVAESQEYREHVFAMGAARPRKMRDEKSELELGGTRTVDIVRNIRRSKR